MTEPIQKTESPGQNSSLATYVLRGASKCAMNYTTKACVTNNDLTLQTPDDHLRLMTQGLSTNPHGAVMVGWHPLKRPAWYKAYLDSGRDQLSRFTNEPDVFLTPNIFHGWRLVRLLKGLSAFFIDIDDHSGRAVDVMRLRANAEATWVRQGIPEPNFIVYSGRGIHLYWLVNNVPAQALPRWKAVQKVLCAAFEGDPRSTDPTRLLRLVGTSHNKTGHKVTGEPFFKQRYDFSWFCDEVLPFTQAQVRDFQAAKVRKGEQSTGKQYGSIYQRWYLVYQDLLRVQNHFWFGGMQEPGHRDHMLFHTANALSWFTCSDALANEIKATARILVPSYCTDEVMSYCSSVIDRARRTQQAEGSEFRYKYARKTLWAAFEPIVGQEPELVQQLRAIIPEELHQQREKERQVSRNRTAEGRYKKQTTKSSEMPQLKRRIGKMLSQGLSQKHMSETLGLSKGRVSQLVNQILTRKKG